ncbi:DUF805 domain-containing protein [Foliimonas ilicis]
MERLARTHRGRPAFTVAGRTVIEIWTGYLLSNSNQFIWFFFRFQGRVSRMAYFLGGLLIAIAQAFPLYRATLVPQDSTSGEMWASIFMVALIASLWSNVALGVKRLHDFGKPGIAAIALFIPIVSIAIFLVLCFFPGDRGPNRYGYETNAP